MAELAASATGTAQAAPVRSRKTSRRVRIIDRLTSIGITAGGLLVIVCVLGILVYLLSVVVPLFRGAQLADRRSLSLLGPAEANNALFCDVDEYRTIGACLLASGDLQIFSTATGEASERRTLWPPEQTPTAFRRDPRSGRLALALPDGRVRLGRIAFETSFQGADRRTEVVATLDEPMVVAEPPVPIRLLDYRPDQEQGKLAAWLTDGRLLRVDVGGEKNFLTGEVQGAVSSAATLPAPGGEHGEPAFLRINTRGDELYLAWDDGEVARYDLRDLEHPAVVERVDLVPDATTRLMVLEWMLGERSLLAGDSAGAVAAWSRVQVDEDAEQPASLPAADGFVLARVHQLPGHDAAVTAFARSERDKSFATAYADGTVTLFHLTSEQVLAKSRLDGDAAVRLLQITPKGDGLLAVGATGVATIWSLRNPHPETTIRSLFGRIWYEGFPRPEHVWQSSSGTDDFEPKMGLMPLVFGTLKATFYAMLFAVPIALAAAIYTAEFLDRRFHGTVKTTIELMASLPSVVLGFLAALVLAPLVESAALAILVAFGLLPLVALGFGYLLQIAPPELGLRLRGRIQFLILFGILALAAALAGPAAALTERVLFAGDFKAWLDGRVGSGRAGLGMLLWPAVMVALLALDRVVLVPILGRGGRPRQQVAVIEAVKFLALVGVSFALSAGLAYLGFAIGLDPRGVLLGTYVQRNALVVGFVMGFAVIPIVYTLSEDALSSVPQSLRSASLGCGATRWQTATRVVLPVALPGIFSALMVGLGRAVGETMIVLMAAGNTPVLDLNLFSGLRTLSANIAVELPEAVKDGTLYRVLFLAALTLFVLTFAFNTAAELVRQRLRKRYAQL